MNKAFTKRKEIVLDENYKIVPDSDSGVILVFNENRIKEKIIKEGGKEINTGLFENYIFTEKLYYPRIAQAFRYYASKVMNTDNNNILDFVSKSEAVYDLIDKIDKEFKQF